MLILLLPLTTICVAVVGFYVWHRQLIRKRHFEVADAALSAFSRTEAALTYARNPARFVGEGTTRKRDNTELQPRSELLDRLFIPVERLRQHNEAFGELERVAFAVEVHFGDDVACRRFGVHLNDVDDVGERQAADEIIAFVAFAVWTLREIAEECEIRGIPWVIDRHAPTGLHCVPGIEIRELTQQELVRIGPLVRMLTLQLLW